MKILLTILCGLAVLFGGGCALVVFGGSPLGAETLGLLPMTAAAGGVAVLNLVTILSIWGAIAPARKSMQALAGVDLVLAGLIVALWSGVVGSDSNSVAVGAVAIGLLLLKGIGTFIYARTL